MKRTHPFFRNLRRCCQTDSGTIAYTVTRIRDGIGYPNDICAHDHRCALQILNLWILGGARRGDTALVSRYHDLATVRAYRYTRIGWCRWLTPRAFK